jgi:hypothetical protein
LRASYGAAAVNEIGKAGIREICVLAWKRDQEPHFLIRPKPCATAKSEGRSRAAPLDMRHFDDLQAQVRTPGPLSKTSDKAAALHTSG